MFTQFEWTEARAMIDGDREFGRWCSQNFWEQNIETLRLLRIRFEVFGARQDEMREAGIGVSSQYLLAGSPATASVRWKLTHGCAFLRRFLHANSKPLPTDIGTIPHMADARMQRHPEVLAYAPRSNAGRFCLWTNPAAAPGFCFCRLDRLPHRIPDQCRSPLHTKCTRIYLSI